MFTSSQLREKAPTETLPAAETLSEAKPLTNRAREQQRFNVALAISLLVLVAVVAVGVAIL